MKKYTCISCGNTLKELYKEYSPTVLKVMSCDNCNQIADKYIEYDPIIIIIDMILLNKQAYRHILYNTNFETHWKLLVFILLMQVYTEWMLEINLFWITTSLPEKNFPLICVQILLGWIVFFASVLLLTRFIEFKAQKPTISSIVIWKSLSISSFGHFLLLPALIWGGTEVAKTHFVIVFGYTLLSELLVYTVVCNCSWIQSTFVIMLAQITKIYVTYMFAYYGYTLFDNYLKHLL